MTPVKPNIDEQLIKGMPKNIEEKKGGIQTLTKKQQGIWQIKQDQTKQDEADNDYTRWE